jgi:hypothetical protein
VNLMVVWVHIVLVGGLLLGWLVVGQVWGHKMVRLNLVLK